RLFFNFPAGFDGLRYGCDIWRGTTAINGCSMFYNLLSPVVDEGFGLVISKETALDAFWTACIGRQVEHVTTTQKAFGTTHVDDGTRVYGRANHEGDTGGNVGLNETGDNIDRRSLGSNDEMYASSTS